MPDHLCAIFLDEDHDSDPDQDEESMRTVTKIGIMRWIGGRNHPSKEKTMGLTLLRPIENLKSKIENPGSFGSEPIAGYLMTQYVRHSVHGVRMQVRMNGGGLSTKSNAVGGTAPLLV